MATYYAQELASRILSDADRSSLSSADNGDYTGAAKGKYILAVVIGYNGKDTAASTYKLQWRNETDNPGGTFSDVGATGEVKYSSSSGVLVDDTTITTTTRRCDEQSGQTWEDKGKENVGDNLMPDTGSIDLSSDCYCEIQWAIDLSDSHSGDQYTFQVYNNTAGAAITNSPCDAQITIQAAAVEYFSVSMIAYPVPG